MACNHWRASEFFDLDPCKPTNYSPDVSLPTINYNCIGWAYDPTKITDNWMWPKHKGKWPKTVPRDLTLDAFIKVFAIKGYGECDHPELEDGIEKVALFARNENGYKIPTHAARQLADGTWTSKIGPNEDIIHYKLEAVNGPLYGKPERYLARSRKG